VVRLDHLGDVLMSTPALAALRRAHPGAKIAVLAAPWGRAALDGNPDVDVVIEAPAPWYDPRRGDLPGPGDVLSVAASLRRHAYDWALDLRGDPRVVAAYLLPAARRRFGFSGLGGERLLTDAIPYERRRSILDLALDLAAAAGAPAASRRPVFRVEDGDREEAGALIAGGSRGRDGDGLAVIAPGSNRAAARWPAGRFAAVGDGLEAAGLRVVLAGREADAPVTSEVAASMAHRPTDLTGRTRLSTLAAVLERAELLLANDSGSSHLAAAVDCPTVAVFGPTDPELPFPYDDGRRYVSVSAPIDHPRPCFDLACASDHGFDAIQAGRVLEACLAVLRERGRSPS
jgi:heptosyltransferase-2/heptosyltransferase-3